PETTAVTGTFALSVGRFLRNNRFLKGVHKWVFERTVPIVFALLLVTAGSLIGNRILFDIVSASGQFCRGSADSKKRAVEKSATADNIFQTDQTCWASGLVLKEGERYMVTVATPGDWFDRTIRADVAGFAAANFRQMSATPLKRWWRKDWFTPI